MNTHKAFKEGLEKIGLMPEDLNNYIEDYSTRNREDTNCVCGHFIIHVKRLKPKTNYYILDMEKNNKIIALKIGSCCIKKFMPEGTLGNHCLKCDKTHRNRITDYCNKCRDTCIMEECSSKATIGVLCNLHYNLQNPRPPNKCKTCGKCCGNFIRCFQCNVKNKNLLSSFN
jgi:hypothetical protein